MAGPKKNASKAHGGRTTSNGALLSHQQQKKMAIGWLYTATEKYTNERPEQRIKSIKNIQYCLEKIMTTLFPNSLSVFDNSWSVFALESVATYPFQKCSWTDKHSPFMHACLQEKTEVVEYYLSLYILLQLTNSDIRLTENNQRFSNAHSYRQWLSVNGKASTCHILNEFDRIFSNIGDDNMIHVMSGNFDPDWI